MVKRMHITASQESVINLAFNMSKNWRKESPDKNYIIFEAGGPQMTDDGRILFVGSFIAHLARRGNYRFDAGLEQRDGKQNITINHKKNK